MLAELAESAEKLARSERESAWREMAKQVAHEIKNPLTPMKFKSSQNFPPTVFEVLEDFQAQSLKKHKCFGDLEKS